MREASQSATRASLTTVGGVSYWRPVSLCLAAIGGPLVLKPYLPAIVIVLGFAAVGTAVAVLLLPYVDLSSPTARPGGAGGEPASSLPAVMAEASFLSPRIDDAPPGLAQAVARGARLMGVSGPIGGHRQDGPLECANCHFEGGTLAGGRNGGISLVGVAAKYPTPYPTTGRVVSLADRVTACAGENGARAFTVEELADVLVYLQWISRGTPVYASIPWLGIRTLPAPVGADSDAGRFAFASTCAPCHGPGGTGTAIAPAVWGQHSFTAASALASPPTLAAFVHHNMPRQNPTLDPQQAADIAAFVLAQARPAAP